ncbi:MAG: hypothetical protein Kow002_18640 [Anaerolineales bacterium]
MRKSLFLVMVFLLSSCNFPVLSSGSLDINAQAGTVVAMTLTAVSSAGQTPVPTATLPVLTSTPAVTITPTYAKPMLRLSENTNCRSGPGQSFDILVTLLAGAEVEIAGKHPSENYWVVRAQGVNELCWLWGEFATPSGSHWTVQTMTPPPTSTARPANRPGNLNYTYLCTYNGVNSDVAVTLTWKDQSDDEIGYRIYRDNALVSELPPNAKTYSETIAADATQTLTYSVAAYNTAGESERATISFRCQ